jgi:hypothetical protein
VNAADQMYVALNQCCLFLWVRFRCREQLEMYDGTLCTSIYQDTFFCDPVQIR